MTEYWKNILVCQKKGDEPLECGITDYLGETLASLAGNGNDGITTLVIVVCVVLFALSFFIPRLRDISPALMVSAGIIGTFWGTFIALKYYKVGDIKSIDMVIEGMKAAFVTSLIGLFFAFVSKIMFRFMPMPKSETDIKMLPSERLIVDLLRQIKDGIIGEGDKSLSSQINILQAEYRDSADTLKQAISGESDSSIASQLIKLRNENNAGFKAIDNKLEALENVNNTGFNKIDTRLEEVKSGNNEGFNALGSRIEELKNENVVWFKVLDNRLEGLADTINNSLVKTIEKLIVDLRDIIVNELVSQLQQTNELLRTQLTDMIARIETALIEQFGKTFKEFNEATQAIKKWQEDHRVQVEQLTHAFETTATGIEKIRADCESIPATMESLRNLMGELNERVKAFADMKKAAEESFPVIKQHLDTIGADLQKSAEGFSGLEKTITETYTQANDLAQQQIAMAQSHIENVGTEINRTAEQLSSTATGMITESQNAAQQHLTAIQAIVTEVKNTSQHCIQETQNIVATSAKNIENQITQVTAQVATASENMINESRNSSTQHQEAIRGIVDDMQKASNICVEETRNSLKEFAEQHAQTTNDAMSEIAKRWGENMIGIADKAAEIIRNGSRK